ncbi:MAG: tRNA 2-thiouridine(34) synthase MnmA [Candidatus Cloacimonetes bacterium]|nr:tRNA 2-thiouridine(34) synthase MnmA [Candidatus Cloacimonadota bacterium]
MKIAVAMSGGVDSSATAALLIDQGHEVIGTTMRHFDNEKYGFSENEGIELAVKDAEQVCKTLGILHYVLDIRKDFYQIVEKKFIAEYKNGRTPNPCTHCNPTIKWGVFHKQVLELGVEKVATGHYVKLLEKAGLYQIHIASDLKKDQSYYLWGLDQKQLATTLFPLAQLQKSQVREIAFKFKLPVHEKSDSQEICFIKGHYENYLKDHLILKPGDIVLPNGTVIGRHRGLPLYTIGQRKGLNTPWQRPLYVLKIDIKTNQLIVTDNPDDLLNDEVILEDINWIAGTKPESNKNISIQIRYNSKPVPVKEIKQQGKQLKIIFESETRAMTPGQSGVFYQNNLLLGGGIIK